MKPQEGLDLDRFHHLNGKGDPTSVYDYEIFEYLKEINSLFILGGVPYLYEGGAYFPDISGAKLKTMIRSLIYPQFIRAATINRIYELFLGAAELEVETEEINNYPPEWICFRNGFYDPVHRKMIPHSPMYRAVNQIPHEFHPEQETTEGERLEEWFRFIFNSQGDREMFLQFAGYCMTRDTRQQKFLILSGGGGTGKSTLIRLLEAVIGVRNISNVSLQELGQRFASFGLLGKLLNSCADLEVNALEDTSTLKKLLGEDLVRGEAKGKQPVFFRNYAKLIFSTNELPTVKAERTNGFYRRLLILTMDKTPERRRSDFFSDIESEIEYFITLCVRALERMYKGGTLKESSGSVEAVLRLWCESDTVQAFLDNKDYVLQSPKSKEKKGNVFLAYLDFCRNEDRTPMKRNGFYKAMRSKGFSEVSDHNDVYFRGLSFGKISGNFLEEISDKQPSNGNFSSRSANSETTGGEGEYVPFN